MPSKYGADLDAFYHSKKWQRVSAAYMSSKNYICERCGKPAVICHHKKHLNAQNVHDPEIALNFDNLEALCIECHNAEHFHGNNIPIFDDQGGISAVKESAETRQYKKDRDEIDDVVEKARSLLCGLK